MTNEQQRKDVEDHEICQENESDLKNERKRPKVTFNDNYILTVDDQNHGSLQDQNDNDHLDEVEEKEAEWITFNFWIVLELKSFPIY